MITILKASLHDVFLRYISRVTKHTIHTELVTIYDPSNLA